MRMQDPFRELLAADLAAVLDPDSARGVADVLIRFWEHRDRAEEDLGRELADVAGIDLSDLQGIEDRVDQLVRESRADSPDAWRTRGGVDADWLRTSVGGGARSVTRLLDPEGADRPALRPLPTDRYGEFSRIGVGGMGIVFAAVDRDLDREVALKVVRTGGSDRAASPLEIQAPTGDGRRRRRFAERSSRFLREARVTSRLEHPGVLPVHEVGQTGSAVPYYTMRCIRHGRTLMDALGEARGPRGRLKLLEPFLRVCDTVEYAHSRRVLHRDLKPANIGLGEFGEVLVLDWGLARVEDDEPDVPVASGRAIGTPGYMSPESARGDPVDRRTDVYSLGATLLEILTGKPPLPGREPRVTQDAPEGLRRICERALAGDPENRFSSVGEFAAEIRDWQRRTETDREVDLLLARAESALQGARGLEGDALLSELERVGGLALRVRELRPDDAREKALVRECEDARRRAITLRERTARRRLLRRVMGVSVLVAIAALGTFTWVLDLRRAEAEDARGDAERMARFMLYDLYGKLHSLGRLDLLGPAARVVRDYYAGLAPGDLDADQLTGQGDALLEVGDVLSAEGDLDGALESYRASLRIREYLCELRPDDPDALAGLALTLGRLAHVRSETGSRNLALRGLERAVAIYGALEAVSPEKRHWWDEAVETRLRLALLREQIGDIRMAARLLDSLEAELRSRLEQVPESDRCSDLLTRVLEQSAGIHANRDEIEKARELGSEVLRLRLRSVERHPGDFQRKDELARAHLRLGTACSDGGDLDEALEQYRRGLDLRRSLTNRDPTNAEWRLAEALALVRLGDLSRVLGDAEGARLHHGEALESARLLRDRGSVSMQELSLLSTIVERLGAERSKSGDLIEALGFYEEAVKIRREVASADPESHRARRDLANCQMNLARRLLESGRCEAADARLEDAIGILDALLGEDPRERRGRYLQGVGRTLLGQVRIRQERRVEAEACYRAAAETLEEIVADDGSYAEGREALAAAEGQLGDLLSKAGRAREAAERLHRALEQREWLVEREPAAAMWHQQLAHGQALLGNHLIRMDRLGEAADVLAGAVESHRRAAELDPSLRAEHDWYVSHHRRWALVGGRIAPETGSDHAILAGEAAETGGPAEVVDHCAWALADLELPRAERREVLLLGTRAAARMLDGTEADPEWRRRALSWLREHVKLCREEIDRKGPRAGPWKAHLDELRYREPDLELIRDDRAFRAIFEEGK